MIVESPPAQSAMLSRRLHLLILGVALTVWLAGPSGAHAETPPESVDRTKPASVDMSPVEREIRSAMMMAMAEARLRAVRDNKVRSPSANSLPARASTESHDSNSAAQSSPESQTTRPKETATPGTPEQQEGRKPTFRTLSRHSDATESKPSRGDESATEPSATDASETSGGRAEPASVEADVPTFDLSKASQRAALERLAPRLSLSCDEDCRGKAFVGTFSKRAAKKNSDDAQPRDSSDRGNVPVEVAVVQDTTLSIYRRGRLLDTVELGEGTNSVPDELRRVETIRLIDDGTLQILCHWRLNGGKEGDKDSDDGSEQQNNRKAAVQVGVYKLVGTYIGTPFQRVIAHRSAESKQFRRVGSYEFTRRNDNPAIRWTSHGDNRDASTPGEQETVLIWNHWEGVFRPPGPPPTAPDQTS